MKSLLSITTLLLALPILQTPASPPQQATPARPAQPAPLTAAECKCSIEVTVKRQRSGEPISDVAITTTFNSPAPATPATPVARVALTAMTDNAGHAVFSNLSEGTYVITAQHDGFFGPFSNSTAPTQVTVTASVGPASNNENNAISTLATTIAAGTLGATTAGNLVKQPVQHITVNMIEGGIISGRIQDANHRPAVGIPVAPFQVAYQFGQRVLRQAASQVQTDDLGQFRLFWFAPGEYYLRSAVPPAQAARGGGPNFTSPTYYPGTLDLSRATPIVIREGQEFSGADFGIQTGGGITISGTVTNTLPGRVAPNGQVNRTISTFFLLPRISSFIEPLQAIPNIAIGGRGAADSDATAFEIRGVPPGSYDFYPIFNDGASPRSNIYMGHIPIDAGSDNITGIKTMIQPGVDMKVHVTVTGTPPPTPANRPAQPVSLQNIRMQIRPVDNLPAQLTNGLTGLTMPDTDGNFTLTNIPESRLFVATILGLPVDGYVSEMRQGSRSIMDDSVITIGKATADAVEVVISRSGGTLSGIVQDAQHKPLAGGRVFLIPDLPRRKNLLLYKNYTTSAMGAFTINGIAPGAYKLFAWDSMPQGAEQNEEFISHYDALGTPVTVSTGTPTANVQVTLIQGNR